MVTVALVVCGCGMNGLGTGVLSGDQNTNATVNAGAAIGNILQSVLGGNAKLTQQQLIGTWTYTRPGCAFTSEKLLAQAGGEVVASEIKTKLQPSYQKVGITSSNTQVTFNQASAGFMVV